jgi:hypothetical protein
MQTYKVTAVNSPAPLPAYEISLPTIVNEIAMNY